MLYQNLQDYLSKGRNKKDRPSLNNTRIQVIDDNTIGVKLHDTYVVTVTSDNIVTLNTDGWYTATTKDRINHYLPSGIYVYQDQGIWYLKVNKKVYGFKDNMTINLNNLKVTGYSPDNSYKKAIKKQINKYTREYAKAFLNGEIPNPDSGDCWFCHLVDENDNSLGEVTHNTDHLIAHFEQKYYVPSLLVTAIKRVPTSLMFKSIVFSYWFNGEELFMNDYIEHEIKSVLRSFLSNQFEMQSTRTCLHNENLLEQV